jgi:hypothetical protein
MNGRTMRTRREWVRIENKIISNITNGYMCEFEVDVWWKKNQKSSRRQQWVECGECEIIFFYFMLCCILVCNLKTPDLFDWISSISSQLLIMFDSLTLSSVLFISNVCNFLMKIIIEITAAAVEWRRIENNKKNKIYQNDIINWEEEEEMWILNKIKWKRSFNFFEYEVYIWRIWKEERMKKKRWNIVHLCV